MIKKLKVNWLTFLILSIIICVGFIVTIVLTFTNVTEWSLITGYILGIIGFMTIIPLITFSVKRLVETENKYFYLLLFLIRLGVIFVPFLCAIYLPNIFDVKGILIALVPLGTYFLFKYFSDGKGNRKIKGGE
jgi:uncharacterized membrane protein YhaH (DUF805 family)